MHEAMPDVVPRPTALERLEAYERLLQDGDTPDGRNTAAGARSVLVIAIEQLEHDRELLSRLAQRDTLTIGSVTGQPTLTWHRRGRPPARAVLELRRWLTQQLPEVRTR